MHAATSSGFVVNMEPAETFPLHNTAEAIFERLEALGPTSPAGQLGFRFGRSGVRVPAIAISP